MATNENDYHVPNLDRALVILEKLSQNPAGLNRNEIAAAADCSPTMVYRIMQTFAGQGWVYRNEATGAYRLSTKLLDIGIAGSDEYSLTAVAWPEMVALRDETNITVMLGCLYNKEEGLLLETAESRSPMRFAVEKGIRIRDLHAGAGWKSILAFLPGQELETLLGKLSFRKITSTTIISREAFLKELASIRRKGYATDNAEITEGVHCTAAPIFDRTGYPVGTLSLSAPAFQMPTGDFTQRGLQNRAASDRVSAKLGWVRK